MKPTGYGNGAKESRSASMKTVSIDNDTHDRLRKLADAGHTTLGRMVGRLVRDREKALCRRRVGDEKGGGVMDDKEFSRRLDRRIADLESALTEARNALDALMGDTDLDDDDSQELHAMRRISELLQTPSTGGTEKLK